MPRLFIAPRLALVLALGLAGSASAQSFAERADALIATYHESDLFNGVAPEPPDRPVGHALAVAIETDGLETATRWYRARLDDPAGYNVSEDQLNELDYARGETATALRLFKLNVEAYPDAWNMHDSLGEALAASGAAPMPSSPPTSGRSPSTPTTRTVARGWTGSATTATRAASIGLSRVDLRAWLLPWLFRVSCCVGALQTTQSGIHTPGEPGTQGLKPH